MNGIDVVRIKDLVGPVEDNKVFYETAIDYYATNFMFPIDSPMVANTDRLIGHGLDPSNADNYLEPWQQQLYDATWGAGEDIYIFGLNKDSDKAYRSGLTGWSRQNSLQVLLDPFSGETLEETMVLIYGAMSHQWSLNMFRGGFRAAVNVGGIVVTFAYSPLWGYLKEKTSGFWEWVKKYFEW